MAEVKTDPIEELLGEMLDYIHENEVYRHSEGMWIIPAYNGFPVLYSTEQLVQKFLKESEDNERRKR